MPQTDQTPVVVQYPSGHLVAFPDEETASAQAPSVWNTLQRETSSAVSALNPINLVKGAYHAAADPLTDEEKADFNGHTRIPGEVAVERLTGAPIVRAANWYRDAIQGKNPDAYAQALSVAPEALGAGAGTVVLGKAASEAPSALKTAAKSTKTAITAPTATKLTAAEQAAADFANNTYGKAPSGVLESTGEADDNAITGRRAQKAEIAPTEDVINQFIKKQFGNTAPRVKIVDSTPSAASSELDSAADAYNKQFSTGVKLGKAKTVGENVEHTIYKNDEPIGVVNAKLGEDGTATLNWIGDKAMTNGVSNKLGVSGLKAIKSAFQDAHPEVKSLSGIRIGGAKGNLAKSVNVEVHGDPAPSDTPSDAPATSNLAKAVTPGAAPEAPASPATPSSPLATALTSTPATPTAPPTASTAPERPSDALPSPVEDKLTELYTAAMPSFELSGANEEHSFTYNKFGNPGTVSTSRQNMKNSVSILPGITSGIVHTHPMKSIPRPSDEDVEIARKAKVPNYVLTRTQLWVATPDGKTRQVANVAVKGGKVQLNYLPIPSK